MTGDVSPIPRGALKHFSELGNVDHDQFDGFTHEDVADYALALMDALAASNVALSHVAGKHGGCRCGSDVQVWDPLKNARRLLGESDE